MTQQINFLTDQSQPFILAAHFSTGDHMELGIYKQSGDAYFADLSAVSHSMLSEIEMAPRCFEWKYLKGNLDNDDTPAKVFGKQFHESILEPEVFDEKYFTDTEAYLKCPNRTLKLYKEEFKKIEAVNSEKILIKHADWLNIQGMRNALKDSIASLALSRGQSEQTVCWDDPEVKVNGVPVRCKAKVDFIFEASDGSLIPVDVKTTEDARPRQFTNSVMLYRSFRQVASYMRGIALATGRPCKRGVLIAIEKKAPWLHKTYEIAEAWLWAGMDDPAIGYKKLLQTYASCKTANIWPGYERENEVEILTPPAWYVKEVQDQLDREELTQ